MYVFFGDGKETTRIDFGVKGQGYWKLYSLSHYPNNNVLSAYFKTTLSTATILRLHEIEKKFVSNCMLIRPEISI